MDRSTARGAAGATPTGRAKVTLNDDTELVMDIENLRLQSEERKKHASHWQLDALMAVVTAAVASLVVCFCVVPTLSLSQRELAVMAQLALAQLVLLGAYMVAPLLLLHSRLRFRRQVVLFWISLASGLFSLIVLLLWLIHLGRHLVVHHPLVWTLCYTVPLLFSVGAHCWLLVARASLLDLFHGYAVHVHLLREATQLQNVLPGGPVRKNE